MDLAHLARLGHHARLLRVPGVRCGQFGRGRQGVRGRGHPSELNRNGVSLATSPTRSAPTTAPRRQRDQSGSMSFVIRGRGGSERRPRSAAFHQSTAARPFYLRDVGKIRVEAKFRRHFRPQRTRRRRRGPSDGRRAPSRALSPCAGAKTVGRCSRGRPPSTNSQRACPRR